MRSFGRKLLYVVALVPALLVLDAPGVAHAGTFVVDDDMACPGAQVPTIQQAVNAALPGDTVRVCAGTYNETVLVTKTLTLRGAKFGVDARTRANTGESVVTGSGGSFDVQADNVVIDGFTVKNAINAPGIYLHAANNGSKVTNNIIKNSTFGVYFNSSGAGLTTVSFNRFSNNNVAGSAAGNAIYSDQGVKGGRIKSNLMEGHQNAGVLIALTAQTVDDVVVKSNSSINNASFLAAFHGTNLVVNQNTTNDTVATDDGDQGSAIFIGGNAAGVLVSANFVKNSPWSGIAVRMSASGVTVQANTVKKAGKSGFGGDGISVSSSAAGGVSLLSNAVSDGNFNGIALDDTSSGATITGNSSLNNNLGSGPWVDCSDTTLGEGTAGTANNWTSNTGNTASPPGICVP